MVIFELQLFGSPQLMVDRTAVNLERRQATALLSWLALATEGDARSIRREDVATLFWPDDDPETARAALRRTLAVLKKALGGRLLVADRESIRLQRAQPDCELRVDVERFRALLVQCRHYGGPAPTICESCLLPLTEAAAIYRGDFMSGFSLPAGVEFDEWQRLQSDNLRCELAGVLAKLVTGLLERQLFQQALRYAQRWLLLDPLHEPAQRSLMELYARAGQPRMALRQYQECTALLERELGIAPHAETRQLAEAIRNERLPAAPERRLPARAGTNAAQLVHYAPASARDVAYQTRLVGREREWVAAQRECDLARAGAVRVLLVRGEAGVGTSHFARELCAAIQAAGGVALVARAGALAQPENALLAEWTRHALEGAEGARRRAALSAHTLETLADVAPELLPPTPAARAQPAAPRERRHTPPQDLLHLWNSFFTLLEALAETSAGPLCLLLDHADAADQSSLGALDFVLHRAHETRMGLLVIFTARAQLPVEPPPFWLATAPALRREQQLRELHLHRLSRAETEKMAASLLGAPGALDPGLADALFSRSAGTPLYVEQLCRAGVELGAIISTQGLWLLNAGAELAPPPDVCADLSARLARLPSAARDLISLAAAAEEPIPRNLLQRAGGHDDETFVSALETALFAGLLNEAAGDGEPGYQIAHPMLEAALRVVCSAPRLQLARRRLRMGAAQGSDGSFALT